MASADRFASQASSALAAEIAAVVERLRRVTVQVRGGRGGAAGVLWGSGRPRKQWVITEAPVVHRPRAGVVVPERRFLYAREPSANSLSAGASLTDSACS